MAQRISKTNKSKRGMSAGYHPTFHEETTELATVPVCQSDGSIRFVTAEDFSWLIENKTDFTETSTSENPACQS